MSKEFSKDKSPEQNIKTSIDRILGKDTTIKRKRKSANDLKKEIFCQFIDAMNYLDFRNGDLHEKYLMNMDEYDEPFMNSIDILLKLTFNARQLELIYFYLYERVDIEGKAIAMKGDDGKIIPTDTPEQLWNAILNLV